MKKSSMDMGAHGWAAIKSFIPFNISKVASGLVSRATSKVVSKVASGLVLLGVAVGCVGNRLDEIEAWRDEVNVQLQEISLKLKQLETSDTVTDVVPTEDGKGYVIQFKYSPDLTIMNGEDGDNLFESLDYSNEDYVVITMADGKVFNLAKERGLYIKFESYEPLECQAEGTSFGILMPSYMKESEYMTIFASMMPMNQSGFADEVAPGNLWKVTITPPTFQGNLYLPGSASVKVVPNDFLSEVLLTVTMLDASGHEYSASRVLTYSGAYN